MGDQVNGRRGTVVRSRGFVPWGAAGVPELLIPPLPVSTQSPDPEVLERARMAVHALPDGTPLLRAPDRLFARFVDQVRLVRLSTPVVSVDIAADDDGQIQDVVMDAEGRMVVLDVVAGGRRFNVRRLRPDGTVEWTMADLPARYYSRFHADNEGRRVFLLCVEGADRGSGSGQRFLLRVDDRSGQVVRRAGWTPHVRRDGRVFFMRSDDPRRMRGFLGFDAAGNFYARDLDTITRMSPAGDVDWLVDVRDAMPEMAPTQASAVTAAGEVLVTVCDTAGVHVVGLGPRSSSG